MQRHDEVRDMLAANLRRTFTPSSVCNKPFIQIGRALETEQPGVATQHPNTANPSATINPAALINPTLHPAPPSQQQKKIW